MIHQATPIDFNDILSMYASARRFMMEHGNPTQWGSAYPPQETILQDIKQGILFVLEDEEGLYGVFALIAGEDPTYKRFKTVLGLPLRLMRPFIASHQTKGEETYLTNAWNTRDPVIITFASIPMSRI